MLSCLCHHLSLLTDLLFFSATEVSCFPVLVCLLFESVDISVMCLSQRLLQSWTLTPMTVDAHDMFLHLRSIPVSMSGVVVETHISTLHVCVLLLSVDTPGRTLCQRLLPVLRLVL